jgi:Chlorophyll A-B binding protein
MKTQVAALLVTCVTTGQAFVTTTPISKSSLKMTMSNFVDNNTNNDNKESPPIFKKSSTPEMSEAIPFLARPKVLTKELAGDFGFDPLNFSHDRETLWYYREIEIKHARLAMLVSCAL